MKYVLQTIILIIITACSPSLDDQVNKLIESKNKWIKSSPNRNYSYTYLHKCFCGFNDKEIIIQVINGKVASATLNSGKDINIKAFRTIQQHFEYILVVMKKEGWYKNSSIKVKYNEKFGYPSEIIFNKPVMDGHLFINISNMNIQ